MSSEFRVSSREPGTQNPKPETQNPKLKTRNLRRGRRTVFINRKLRELNLKIVYYGPALSGKTTMMVSAGAVR